MEVASAIAIRHAQVAAICGQLALDASLLGPWLSASEASLPGSLRVTVDNRFDRVTFGSRERGQGVAQRALEAMPEGDVRAFGAALAPGATRVLREATLRRGAERAPGALVLGGAWSLAEVSAARAEAGLSELAFDLVASVHERLGGQSFGGVAMDRAGLSLTFGLVMEDARRDAVTEALLAAADEQGMGGLQRAWLRGLLGSFTPRRVNHLSVRLRVERGVVVPGIDIAFHDVPEDFVVVALSTANLHERPGAVLGALMGALVPDRAAAVDVFARVGPEEPAIVEATLESSGVAAGD